MNINSFVKDFTETSDKTQCIKEHIVEKYIPYEKKIAICKNIIKCADYTNNIDGVEKKYYSPNTPMRFLLFSMSIINNYTDIELDKIKDNPDIIGGYNKLNAIGIFEILFRELDREYRELNTILQMMVDDTISKENIFVGYLDTKIDSFKVAYDTIAPIIENKIISFPGSQETK